jgi:hypothetical protein
MNSTVVLSSRVRHIALLVHKISLSYFLNQFMPRIISMPLVSMMMRSDRKCTPLMAILIAKHICVDALFGRSTNTRVLQRGWLASHALVHPHGLSLIELEHNLMFQGKPKYPDSQTRWSGLGRFSLRRWRAPVTEIGPTSTQAVSGRGKARTVANSGASDDGDGWEKEEKFEVEGNLH